MTTIEENIIQNLLGYIPHKLKIDASFYDEEQPLTVSYIDFDFNAIVKSDFNVGASSVPIIEEYDLYKAKPILKPMSDLTIMELQNAVSLDITTRGWFSHMDWTTNEREYLIEKIGYNGWLNEIPYAIIKVLYSLHYDIHNLIGQGFAIDINTLKK
jgi:hypothetical protein